MRWISALLASLFFAMPMALSAPSGNPEQEAHWRSVAEEAVAAMGGDLRWPLPDGQFPAIRQGFSAVEAMVLPDGRLDTVQIMGKSVLPAIDTAWLQQVQGLRLPPPPTGEAVRRILAVSDGSGLKARVIGDAGALNTWLVWRLAEPGLFSYPQELRWRQVEGRAKIGFRITRNGAFVDVALLASSGAPALDDAALQTVKTLIAPPSGSWIGQSAAFSVPIAFELRRPPSKPEAQPLSPQGDGYPDGPKALHPR